MYLFDFDTKCPLGKGRAVQSAEVTFLASYYWMIAYVVGPSKVNFNPYFFQKYNLFIIKFI